MAKSNCEDYYKKEQEAQNKLLRQTSDEEIGKMYRQHNEATEFFRKRGLFV
jgi:hypothetical protein